MTKAALKMHKKMVNIHFELAKFEALYNNLWDKHSEVEISSGKS